MFPWNPFFQVSVGPKRRQNECKSQCEWKIPRKQGLLNTIASKQSNPIGGKGYKDWAKGQRHNPFPLLTVSQKQQIRQS